ncbi:unnamed protein product [Prorocentrum cordatum]|uniref:DUF4116 domain-containing protein n=1 Tax=Prorocentrum cordatum TaxID=2364126 RepID=A0ABN9XN17_9DINO|nr:unnamed protein product [Polarella glacialis]
MVVRIGEGPEGARRGVAVEPPANVAAPAANAAESVEEQALEHATAVEAAAAGTPVPRGDEAELAAEPPATGAVALAVQHTVETLALAVALSWPRSSSRNWPWSAPSPWSSQSSFAGPPVIAMDQVAGLAVEFEAVTGLAADFRVELPSTGSSSCNSVMELETVATELELVVVELPIIKLEFFEGLVLELPVMGLSWTWPWSSAQPSAAFAYLLASLTDVSASRSDLWKGGLVFGCAEGRDAHAGARGPERSGRLDAADGGGGALASRSRPSQTHALRATGLPGPRAAGRGLAHKARPARAAGGGLAAMPLVASGARGRVALDAQSSAQAIDDQWRNFSRQVPLQIAASWRAELRAPGAADRAMVGSVGRGAADLRYARSAETHAPRIDLHISNAPAPMMARATRGPLGVGRKTGHAIEIEDLPARLGPRGFVALAAQLAVLVAGRLALVAAAALPAETNPHVGAPSLEKGGVASGGEANPLHFLSAFLLFILLALAEMTDAALQLRLMQRGDAPLSRRQRLLVYWNNTFSLGGLALFAGWLFTGLSILDRGGQGGADLGCWLLAGLLGIDQRLVASAGRAFAGPGVGAAAGHGRQRLLQGIGAQCSRRAGAPEPPLPMGDGEGEEGGPSWDQKLAADWEALRFAPQDYRANREVVLALVRRSGHALQFASEELRGDEEVVLEAAKHSFGDALQYAPIAMRKDPRFMLDVLKHCPHALGYAFGRDRNDEGAVLQELDGRGYFCGRRADPEGLPFRGGQCDPELGEQCPACGRFQGGGNVILLQDRNFMLQAVGVQWMALRSAEPKIKRDREVVQRAVRSGGLALFLAEEGLHHDRELALEAVRRDWRAFGRLSERLRSDPELAEEAVRQNWKASAQLAPGLREDAKLAEEVVRQCAMAFASLPAKLRGVRELALAAVGSDWRAYEHALEELRGDREIALRAVRQHGLALELTAASLRSDRDLVFEAVRQDWRSLRHASLELRGDRELLAEALRQSGAALRHADEALKSDPDFVAMAMAAQWSTLGVAVQPQHPEHDGLSHEFWLDAAERFPGRGTRPRAARAAAG